MDLPLLHCKQFVQKKLAISYSNCKLTLIWSSSRSFTCPQVKGKAGKSYTSVVWLAYAPVIATYARQKFGSSISAGSFIAFISQSNAVGLRKL